MAVRIEKKGRVWTVIHSRPEAMEAAARPQRRWPMRSPASLRCACAARFASGKGRHGDFDDI